MPPDAPSKIDLGADALKQFLPQHSWEFLSQLAEAVLSSVEEQCTSRSPVHGVRCELTEHPERFHTAGPYSWAGGNVYSRGPK